MKLAQKRKKGSLELSVNAIVILVMAIAVLGLGLAFIRGALTRGQSQVFRAIENADLENPASELSPLTLDYQVTASSRKAGDLHVGYFNVGSEEQTITVDVTCYDDASAELTGVSNTALPLKASPGEAVAFITPVTVDSVTAGRYSCLLNVTNATKTEVYKSGQFFLQANR